MLAEATAYIAHPRANGAHSLGLSRELQISCAAQST